MRIDLRTFTEFGTHSPSPAVRPEAFATEAVRDVVRPVARPAPQPEQVETPRARRRGPSLPSVDANRVRAAVRGFDWLARYHRLDVRGLDRIPKGPAVLVGNHNGGLNPVDGLFLVHYYRSVGYRDPVYVLGHDLLFKNAKMAKVLHSVGIVPASPGMAHRVLEAGHKLLVFPGGDLETLRPYSQRGTIVLAQRRGFARLAMAHEAPIVPIVSAGAHETLIVLRQGKRLARALRLPQWARVHSLPVMLALPWGVMAGPTCVLPYLPLPSKVTVQIGEPLCSPAFDDVDSLYQHTESTMQGILNHLYAERSLPIFG